MTSRLPYIGLTVGAALVIVQFVLAFMLKRSAYQAALGSGGLLLHLFPMALVIASGAAILRRKRPGTPRVLSIVTALASAWATAGAVLIIAVTVGFFAGGSAAVESVVGVSGLILAILLPLLLGLFLYQRRSQQSDVR
jgi:hypothetical protein